MLKLPATQIKNKRNQNEDFIFLRSVEIYIKVPYIQAGPACWTTGTAWLTTQTEYTLGQSINTIIASWPFLQLGGLEIALEKRIVTWKMVKF